MHCYFLISRGKHSFSLIRGFCVAKCSVKKCQYKQDGRKLSSMWESVHICWLSLFVIVVERSQAAPPFTDNSKALKHAALIFAGLQSISNCAKVQMIGEYVNLIQIKQINGRKSVIYVTEARKDYSLFFPVRAGELWLFVGDFLSGSRVMDGGAIFSPKAQNKATLGVFI